jgi:hypothetical protein
MIKVIQTAVTSKIPRSSIVNVALILPLVEVESGLFHLTRALNTYFICYIHLGDGRIQQYPYYVLQPRVAEPLSFQIFGVLNVLSSSLKKSIYHQPEDQSITKSFRLPFRCDPIFFIWFKFLNHNEVLINKIDWTKAFLQTT